MLQGIFIPPSQIPIQIQRSIRRTLSKQWEQAPGTARRSYIWQDHELWQQRPKATHPNSHTSLLLQATKLTSSLPRKHITEPPPKWTEAVPQPATSE